MEWPAAQNRDVVSFGPFRLVAIIMTIVCVGNLVFALMASSFRNK